MKSKILTGGEETATRDVTGVFQMFHLTCAHHMANLTPLGHFLASDIRKNLGN